MQLNITQRRAAAWSLIAIGTGVLLWLVYAIALGSWPMIFSNCVTAPVALAILTMKLRYRNTPAVAP